MVLPLESLTLAYGALFLFICIQILLVLTGGEKGRGLSIFPSMLIVLCIPILALLPVSRHYRNESRREGGGLLESSLFRFDFSDFLSLESSISMKDDLVFVMKKEGLGDDFLVRRFVLPEYEVEKGFFRVPGETLEAPGSLQEELLVGEQAGSWKAPDATLTRRISQEYFLVNFDSSAFLGMNSPVSLTPFEAWDQSSFSRIYAVDSMVSQAWGWDLLESQPPKAVSDADREFLDYYTNFGSQNDIRDLARSIIAGKSTYYERVNAIEEYLQQNYFYSLNPGESADGDPLRNFLFESKKGYCSYFAFSMALLCRSAGIPARVALGFWVDESSGVLAYYPVKANQAHAWVEVYFPGFGWIEFDPTSQTLAAGEDFQIAPFSTQELEPFLKEILENRDQLKIAEASGSSPEEDKKPGLWNRLGSRPILLGLHGFIILLVLIALHRLIRRILVMRRPPASRKKASVYYHLHLMLIETMVKRRRANLESIQDYVRSLDKVKDDGIIEMTGLYEKISLGRSSLEDLQTLFWQGVSMRKSLYSKSSRIGKIEYLYALFLKGRSL
jgi:transglutaminase-like putative cysteine protease